MVSPVRTRRQKIGFNSLMIEWFNGDLATLIENSISHPLWRNSSDFEDLNDRGLILHKTRNRAWTLDDWGLSLRVWTHINMILWELLFIEQDRASVEKLIFEPSPVSSELWN